MLPTLGSFLFFIYNVVLLKSIKWIVRKVTGKCELERIISYERCSSRTSKIESALAYSNSPILRDCINTQPAFDYNKCASEVALFKQIKTTVIESFREEFIYDVRKIHAYRELLLEIEQLKNTSVQSQETKHLALLTQLWNALAPDPETEEIRWTLLGFQSEQPTTDFRGMGLLSLKNMVYFSCNHTKLARSLLSASNHPQKWYPFAIVAINLTELLYSFMQKGYLKTYFYAPCPNPISMNDFHDIFCFVFYSFHEYWMKECRDIMHFNAYRKRFKVLLKKYISSPTCRLKLSGCDGDKPNFDP